MAANSPDPGWWASLNHGGLLIAPSKLAQYFDQVPPNLNARLADKLREDVMRLGITELDASRAKQDEARKALLDVVLEQVCGFHSDNWSRGSDVPAQFSRKAATGEVVRPRRVWQGPLASSLPVFVDQESRLGIGRGRRSVSRVVEWLRAGPEKLALITNHRQWRLVYAGSDFDAWAEWDSALWFEEGRPGPQVEALRTLLTPASFIPSVEGERPRLLAAIEDSRKGQVELSSALGERVRRAVELLIHEHGQRLAQLNTGVTPRHIYIAATRIVMRMVVVLFAEARELLPRSLPVYEDSYGLQGLRASLERIASGAGRSALRQRRGAWPRILGLFRLIHEGSHHVELPVHRYGGQLFAQGSATSHEPIDRAVAVFETLDHEHSPTDAAVEQMLAMLCRSTARVLQGKSARQVEVPVDFSSLSSEYIGILYEGLLDYELRRAADGEVMVFLNVGDQPVLPLSRLEAMDDASLKPLLEKLKKSTKKALASEDDVGGDDDGAEEEEEEDVEPELTVEELAEDESAEDAVEDPVLAQEQVDDVLMTRVYDWARHAVVAAGLLKKPGGKKAQASEVFVKTVDAAASALIGRVVLPGSWFLVLWGGTRKGSGTFYTRPQLAVPTVRRTLQPLAFEGGRPRTPEALLSLKVCDPAVGSGSFLAASLRYLTDVLWQSLLHHEWLVERDGRLMVPQNDERRPAWFLECVKNFPTTTEDPEPPIRARLKRVVVERCLYGVDLDPLAIELARLALWVETMDRDLPFEFLDHRLKVGNALVGCWFDRFEDYPVLAWEREGGDKNHGTFVHHFREKKSGKRSGDKWTDIINQFRAGAAKRELIEWIEKQGTLFGPETDTRVEAVHDTAVALLKAMEALPLHEPEVRAQFYKERLVSNPDYQALREGFDTWCALWFWPADQLADAPTAKTLLAPTDAAKQTVKRLSNEHRFFHWELEFPDVFAAAGSGFDVIVGNPPWETLQPNSREFFSNHDPLYRTYGKQDALARQRALFTERPALEEEWVQYCANYKNLGNWLAYAGDPFGDSVGTAGRFSFGRHSPRLHELWRERRGRHSPYADDDHPFRHQGEGKAYTYKMFLEQGHTLLKPGGQLGFIVPSGVYTDKGSTSIRELFLRQCEWRWLFVFENRQKIFDIDSRFKFGPIIVRKGGVTHEFRAAFMRHDVGDWEDAARHVVPYPRAQVERFSPRTAAVLEIRDRRDLEVLEKIYAHSVLLGDEGPDGWQVKYAQGDFNMTSDAGLFPPRPSWEAQGYQPDEYGRWLKFREKRPVSEHPAEVGWILLADGSGVVHEEVIEDIALPLYQGIMIHAFDWSAKGWLAGTGLNAKWRTVNWNSKRIDPQFLMSAGAYTSDGSSVRGAKLAFRDIARSTDERTIIASLVPDCPCGNVLGLLGSSDADAWTLVSSLNAWVTDWAARIRIGGTHLNWYVVQEIPALQKTALDRSIPEVTAVLAASGTAFAPLWMRQRSERVAWKQRWALTHAERLGSRVVLDALMAEAYGLSAHDLSWILRDCDHPLETVNTDYRRFDPKGFWRSDSQLPPEVRKYVLTMIAFQDLTDEIGRHGGDGSSGRSYFADSWQPPETVCLADYGLGHDDRAKKPQPVRSRLGERFLPWQLEQTVEESWAECERHARNLLGEEGFRRLKESARSADN